MELHGKVAIVTGAGGGIGQEICRQLSQEGATVLAWDINQEITQITQSLNDEIGAQRIIPAQVDISNISVIREQVEQIASQYGKIDILVNNAGIMQTIPFWDIKEQDWDRMLQINLKSVFFLIQAVSKHMVKQKNGSIINISSIAGRSGRPLSAHYAASKTGVLSLTKSAALAFGEYGIRVNAICPGVIQTPMMDQINQERAKIFGRESEPGVALKQFLPNIPVKEVGTPKDVAYQVLHLCLPKSRYIHGQAINVCGGYEMN